jgi:hypothetical protein
VQKSVKFNYKTIKKNSKESENFFTSLGLFKMTDQFWNFSMIEKPLDRQGKNSYKNLY